MMQETFVGSGIVLLVLGMVQTENCPSSNCKVGEVQKVSDKCRLYCLCVGENYIEMICLFGTYFDPEAKKCQTDMSKCDTPPTSKTSSPTATPTPAPQCNGDKKIPVKGSCTEYQECKGGKWSKESCSTCHKFDPVKEDCYLSGWCSWC